MNNDLILEENNGIFIDLLLANTAKIVVAALTRNGCRYAAPELEGRFFSHLVKELSDVVSNPVAADMLGVSIRTIRRRRKVTMRKVRLSVSARLLRYLALETKVERAVLFRHFCDLDPNLIASSLRDLVLQGWITIEKQTIELRNSFDESEGSALPNLIFNIINEELEISVAELMERTGVATKQMHAFLEHLQAKQAIQFLDEERVKAISVIEISDRMISNDELLVNLMGLIDAVTKTVLVRLGESDPRNARGTLVGLHIPTASPHMEKLHLIFEQVDVLINEFFDEANSEDSEPSTNTSHLTYLYYGHCISELRSPEPKLADTE